jgi:hypothetical protein
MPDGLETVQMLREKAARCRRLAEAVWDHEIECRLLEVALEFEERADANEARERAPPGRLRKSK